MWMRFIRFNWLFYRSDHWSLSFYLFIQIKINGLAEGSEFLLLHSIFVLCVLFFLFFFLKTSKTRVP